MNTKQEKLTLENWSEYSLGDLKEGRDEQIWNRFVVLKQAEINTMMGLLTQMAKSGRGDTLSSAQTDGGSDPLPD